MTETTGILAINAGSSSVKFALFDEVEPSALPTARLRGSVSEMEGKAPAFRLTDGRDKTVVDEHWPAGDIGAVVDQLIEWIEDHLGDTELAAIGHRVVHGGREFSEPVRVDDGVLSKLDALTPLAPLHQPASLAPIRRLRASRPDLAQFACFDTAFHHSLADPVSRYALPRSLESEGVRRYGFHGLSYEAIATKLAAQNDGAIDQKIVVAHLGSGASLCAMRGLRSVDTTMGFTALDGIMMGTRPGALDPGILLYLMRTKGYDADRLERLLYHESGLLGVSGISDDVQALLASDTAEAQEALELFAFLVARHTAALASTLGGIDRFVFTGGVGQHAARVRAMIVERMRWLGAALDAKANEDDCAVISRSSGSMRLEVIETDEEGMIAMHVRSALASSV